MITKTDIEKNIAWLARVNKEEGCIYDYIENPKVRANKCLSIFPKLKKRKHKACGYQCPCNQYGTLYVIKKIKKMLAIALVSAEQNATEREVENG